jgi:hypothetical protein
MPTGRPTPTGDHRQEAGVAIAAVIDRIGITGYLHDAFIARVTVKPRVEEAKEVAADDEIVLDDDDAPKSPAHIGHAMGYRTRKTPILVAFDNRNGSKALCGIRYGARFRDGLGVFGKLCRIGKNMKRAPRGFSAGGKAFERPAQMNGPLVDE